MCLYEQLVMYLGAQKNPRQKKRSSVNDFPAGCVVRIAGALWCIVVSQVFICGIRRYMKRMRGVLEGSVGCAEVGN